MQHSRDIVYKISSKSSIYLPLGKLLGKYLLSNNFRHQSNIFFHMTESLGRDDQVPDEME